MLDLDENELRRFTRAVLVRDEELHDEIVEKCARAIEDYHAGPQTVGIILANVIRKLKISTYKTAEAESP